MFFVYNERAHTSTYWHTVVSVDWKEISRTESTICSIQLLLLYTTRFMLSWTAILCLRNDILRVNEIPQRLHFFRMPSWEGDYLCMYTFAHTTYMHIFFSSSGPIPTLTCSVGSYSNLWTLMTSLLFERPVPHQKLHCFDWTARSFRQYTWIPINAP